MQICTDHSLVHAPGCRGKTSTDCCLLRGGSLCVCVLGPVTEGAVPTGTPGLPPHPPEGEGHTHTALQELHSLCQTLSRGGVGGQLVAGH